jgi:hypothetical protein
VTAHQILTTSLARATAAAPQADLDEALRTWVLAPRAEVDAAWDRWHELRYPRPAARLLGVQPAGSRP